MMKLGADYAASKAKARKLLIDYLKDLETSITSVSMRNVRQLFHHAGYDAFMSPVLRDLEREGKIEVWREGRSGVLYLTDRRLDDDSPGFQDAGADTKSD